MAYNPFERTPKGIDLVWREKSTQRREQTKAHEGQQREQEERFVLETAYQKALDLFAEEEPIDPVSFRLYDPKMIKKDLEYVARMERTFAEDDAKSPELIEQRKLALILEAILHEQIELNNWLGADVTTKKASRYDDIKHGVDSIAEFNRDGSRHHLALALDVTSTRYTDDKLTRIRDDIDHGRLTYIRYFQSSDGSYKGSLSNVPRVVIGVDPRRIVDLARLWIQNKNKALAQHPLQIQILEQIKLQLFTFKTYAESVDQSRLAEILANQLELIRKILQETSKQSLARQPDTQTFIRQDRVHGKIESSMSLFKNQRSPS